MAKPKNLFMKKPSGEEWADEEHHPLGQVVDLQADGESGDAAAGQETSVILRVFYRIDGFPFAEILYNDRASDGLNFGTTAGKLKKIRPSFTGVLEYTAIAWDHRNRPNDKTQIKDKNLVIHVQADPT